ncbi:MAG TPA: hypothetical protein VJT82_00300, partial [Pyrinomonadaceae bacterium]|nr:hypothetical protein [Pyrinomonadaceae bacterium]
MLIRRYQLLTILSLVLFATSAFAQSEQKAQGQSSATPVVSASASAEGVRFAAPESVLQMRLEIYGANGEPVFDSGARAGSILDWKTTDVAQGLADGSYLSVVTVKDFQGKLRQRLGALAVQSGQVTLKRVKQEELSAGQSQALAASRQSQKIEVAEKDDALTIMREGKERAATITAHDGQDGQVTSTTGALTFRTGDTLAKQDREQMRITPDGRVGI